MTIVRGLVLAVLLAIVALQQVEMQRLKDANFELEGAVSSYDAYLTRHPPSQVECAPAATAPSPVADVPVRP
jgi:hypothetical protein